MECITGIFRAGVLPRTANFCIAFHDSFLFSPLSLNEPSASSHVEQLMCEVKTTKS